jgi:predicted peroxiredoxin
MNTKQALMKTLLVVFTLAFGGQYALAEYPMVMKGQHGNPEQCKKMRGMHGDPEQCMEMKKHYNKGVVSEALVILSSDSLQTQGMAMVLGNTMLKSGTKVNVLLCDAAGDLALKNSESSLMKPKDVSPKMLLNKLKGQGAQVSVCALYLPNNEFSKDDLLEGVGVAKPNEIAAQMTNRHIRVFTF